MFSPAEKGTTIRQPSTANLMLDSVDRNTTTYPNANSFQITKNQALLNGFFTRVATTEVVFEYRENNISAALGNDTLIVDLSGTVSGTISQTVTLASGNYTAAALCDAVAGALTDISGTWTASALPTQLGAEIEPAANVYLRLDGPVADLLGIGTLGYNLLGPTGTDRLGAFPEAVDLRPFRYLDFVSAQLTYNQDLKDAATNKTVRDVLCRWYMAWDNPPELDAYGFPILMGYVPFTARRIFNPPKQIRWDPQQPLGNLAFEVYTNQNALAPFRPFVEDGSEWLMTLQVSEV